MFSLNSDSDIPDDIPSHLVAPLEIMPSKQGLPTAKEGGKMLHSLYNPLREAEQAARGAKSSITDCYGCAFFSFGLGYTALSYATLFPNDTIILVENDPRYFFTALSLVDWSPIFSVKNCIIALGTGIDSVVSLIEKTGGIKHTVLLENPAQSAHSADYFSALHSLLERNRRKIEINASTLEKFSKLWLKNTCKNLDYLKTLDGISIFSDSCPPSLPAVILAAGPSLQEVLPHLAQIKKRAILIAVDTALRACLRAGVEPDFVVLADPQYYAYRHIAGLSSPSSILITESAAYPAVFRFKCKKIIMCASLFPLGHYIESKIGSKGELVAGGSVSTTAWDFARFIGAKEIFCAGLDLGYPHFQTHIPGSTFEENIHTKSGRLSPAEKLTSALLFGADIQKESDYKGESILTDSKMKMFAWWFESKAEEFKKTIKNYTLSENSLKIPNFAVKSIEELLCRPELSSQKEEFFKRAGNVQFPYEGGIGNDHDCLPKTCETSFERAPVKAMSEQFSPSKAETFDTALQNLKDGLEELYATAKKGISLAEQGLISKNPKDFLNNLAKIDSKILHSEYKEIASLVFPSEKKLAAIFENLTPMGDEIKFSFQKSKIIYKELMKGIQLYRKYL